MSDHAEEEQDEQDDNQQTNQATPGIHSFLLQDSGIDVICIWRIPRNGDRRREGSVSGGGRPAPAIPTSGQVGVARSEVGAEG